jgi:hypothetical protein
MALMPPDGYPIKSFAELRAAMDRAQYDQRAALAVRNFLMEAQYYRALVVSGQMSQDKYFIALEELRALQRMAAEKGMELGFDIREPGGRIIRQLHPPALPPAIEAAKSKEVAKKEPMSPEGVHFTSHQRVGDQIRDSYIEHIHEMFAGGFIDAGEHDARLAAMMSAHTKEEMEFLIQDLPKVSPPGKEPAPAEVVKERWTLDPAAGWMFAFLSLLGVGGVISVAAPNIFSVILAMIFLCTAVAAVVTTVTGIVIKRKK